jgi:putative transposase
VATELRSIHRAPTDAAAVAALTAFGQSATRQRYPTTRRSGTGTGSMCGRFLPTRPRFAASCTQRTRSRVSTLHMQLRKITKTRGHFPTDEAALKLLYLGIRNITAKWVNARQHWEAALTHFAQLFGDRFIPDA